MAVQTRGCSRRGVSVGADFLVGSNKLMCRCVLLPREFFFLGGGESLRPAMVRIPGQYAPIKMKREMVALQDTPGTTYVHQLQIFTMKLVGLFF